GTVAHTQTIQAVKAKMSNDASTQASQAVENTQQSTEDSNSLWWLIAAAAILAASLTALLVYAPSGGL
ncbi:MAG: hypothetical protein ABIP02_06635, partial [Arenimonas sp.]